MEGKLIEYSLLRIRQDLKDQLDTILVSTPISLDIYRQIKDDYDYCNLLLRVCRSNTKLAKIG